VGNQVGDAAFIGFCDSVEDSVNVKDPSKLPGPEGVGLERALNGYAKHVRPVVSPYKELYCKSASTAACFGTHDKNDVQYRDMTVSNTFNRQWYWFLCNEPFEWW
jgi:hypothetical protein